MNTLHRSRNKFLPRSQFALFSFRLKEKSYWVATVIIESVRVCSELTCVRNPICGKNRIFLRVNYYRLTDLMCWFLKHLTSQIAEFGNP